MIVGIDRIELVVADLEKFISLFEKMGFEVILRTPHHGGSAEMKLPGEGQTIFDCTQ
jgi:catechol 2,3-dioxygenase-like lactoylglutathione lyase family enzyme